MRDQRFDTHFRRVKRTLGSAPEEGWIFGVCSALARRFSWELWAVRLVAVICLLCFSLVTVVTYFATAMIMDETRPGAQRKLRHWANKADRLMDRVWSSLANPSH